MSDLHGGPTRRGVLIGTGLGACALGLAACASGANGTDGTAPDVVQETEDAPLAALADIPVGGAVTATTADGFALLLTQPVEGEVHAFSSTCPHQGCTVLPGDGDLRCPCHSSSFSLTDAAVQSGPSPEPLAEVPVVVDGGEVRLA